MVIIRHLLQTSDAQKLVKDFPCMLDVVCFAGVQPQLTSEAIHTLQLSLRYGANINVRNRKGRTTLHRHMRVDHRWDPLKVRPNGNREKRLISFLIGHGADPFSRDNSGWSIADDVYRGLGCWTQDLWDWAIVVNGYDINVMRQGFPRRRSDDAEYLRLLWEGSEDMCPYYDNPLFWCPHKVVKSELSAEFEPMIDKTTGHASSGLTVHCEVCFQLSKVCACTRWQDTCLIQHR